MTRLDRESGRTGLGSGVGMADPDPLGPEPFFFEEFFRDGLHLACRDCGAHIVARFGYEGSRIPYWQRRMSVVCRHCGFNRTGERAYDDWLDGVALRSSVITPWIGFGILRPSREQGNLRPSWERRAGIWATARLYGEEIVALNRWHLTSMRAYIAPRLRPECLAETIATQDWRNRLPDWIKLTVNRADVLRCLSRLEGRLRAFR